MSFDYTLFPIPSPENCIDLKIGFPSPSMLPLEEIRVAAAEKLSEHDANFLNYGKVQGYKQFRVDLAKFLEPRYLVDVDADSLFITSGTSQGIILMATYYAQRGDTILLENPSYFLARQIFREYGLNVVDVPIGSSASEIEAIIDNLNGVIPKFLYTIPVAHNPTGRTLTLEQKKEMADVARRRNFLIVSDEVYQLLNFTKTEAYPPPFYCVAPDVAVSVTSFSKIFSPASRLGWIQAKPEIISHLSTRCGVLSSGGFNPLSQGILHRTILNGSLGTFIDKTRLDLEERCQVVLDILAKELGHVAEWEIPSGGYFVIVRIIPEKLHLALSDDEEVQTLVSHPAIQSTACSSTDNNCGPDDLPPHAVVPSVNTKDLWKIATSQFRVSFMPGEDFGGLLWKEWIRISFAYYDKHHLTEAVLRLKDAIKVFARETMASSQNKEAK
eukprot:GDKJ01019460.1.p1 GENE.GDKJ01019460.1~~GDKJ01019460.1.p1  ORF type:complete len:450 (+),score=110.23 GDKJ01019460.1:27-1352(+)